MKITKRNALQMMKVFKFVPRVLSGQSRKQNSKVHFETMDSIPDGVEYFRKALLTELEHGRANSITNVTNDDLFLTAKIVTAHLLGVEHDEEPSQWRFFPGYYDALWYMEKAVPM